MEANKERTETILDREGNWKKVDATTPEWIKYYQDYEKWLSSSHNYKTEMDWYMDKPNKPKYFSANND